MNYEAWRISYQDSEQAARALYSEVQRLQASRDAEGDRLDWLLSKLPGNVLRDLVGELSDTGDVAGFRGAIDRAAGFAR